MRRRSLLFALPVASACASGGLEAPNEVLIDEHWVSAGQPTRAGLLRLRSLGFDRVLYLAPSSVGDAIPDEPSLVRAQGLRFDHVPIPWATPELAHVDAVFAVLKDWPAEGRGLVHCQVNMRASVLVFLHRVLVRGHDPELAWTAVSKVWTPEGRWRALIATALQRGGVRFEPLLSGSAAPMLQDDQLQDLRLRFGDRLQTAAALRDAHGRDESFYPPAPPDAVLFAESEQDVLAAVAWCHEQRVPLIPFGAGTSLEGHVLAVQGGLCLDLMRMDRILAIHAEDLTVTVQPGVTREALNAALRDQGLFFPIDPGANASLGGMAATRASGTNAVRYGTLRENVLALRAVLPPGRVVQCGSRAKKSSAGYDLARLLVGSEGTLGVITELTLKLHPLPEAVMAATVQFPSIDAAVQTTIAVIQSGVPIARCELLDANAIRAVNAADQLGLVETPMLLLEFHGSPLAVKEQVESVQAIAADQGGSDFSWAETPEARTRLWRARHRAYWSGLQLHPGHKALTTDVCVPISRLADCVNASLAEAQADGLPYFVVGHVGDGNFHIAYLIDPAIPAQLQRAEALSQRLVRRAIQLGGTCTGEHGIGLHKQAYLREEAGEAAVDTMRAIKAALDPRGIMNPGKIFSAA